MASELLPCPFCGSNQLSFRSTPDMDTDGKFHRISCNECGASSRATFAMDACPLFFEALSKAWNTRPTLVAPVSPDATGKCEELVTVALLNEAKELAFTAISRMRAAHISCLDLTMQAEKLVGNIDTAIRDRSQAECRELETVAWQRKHPTAEWMDCGEEYIPHYRDHGQEVRELSPRSQAVELLAAERAEKEKERLRFEGDLDKWMKIIGAGITGYQPEAYALMDLACEELVKLRADNAAQAARIEELEARCFSSIEPEPGEHQEILDALEAHNSGEEQ